MKLPDSLGRTVSLRAAQPGDATTIAALAVQVFLDTYASEGIRPDLAREAFDAYSIERFAARLAEPERRFVLAEAADGLLGFAEIVIESREAPAGGVRGAQLLRLYVQPSAQRRGIGRALLARAEEAAVAKRLPALWLTAWDGNHRARAFYAGRGYADVGAADYTFQDRTYANRVLSRPLLADERTHRDAA